MQERDVFEISWKYTNKKVQCKKHLLKNKIK